MSSTVPKRALLLAAGRGERLRPLTDVTPKPLIEVAGETLIGHHIRRLKKAGITELAVNVSWLAEQFKTTLGDGSRFGVRLTYFDEGPEPLETAGAIINALDFFKNEPFGVISADVYAELLPPALLPNQYATLWMVKNPAHHLCGDFGLDGHECRPTGVARYTYSGIGTFNPSAFKASSTGKAALRPWFERWLGFGWLGAQLFEGYWCDVGNEQRLNDLKARLAQGSPGASRAWGTTPKP